MKKRYPAIPAVRDKNPTVEKMKELVEIWLGSRGDKLDRVVTYRDLVGSKLGRLTQSGGLAPGDSVTGPAPSYVGPLFNLTAVASMNFIILSWSGVNQSGYSYTEIWRASDDNLGSAVLAGTTPAQVYSDGVGGGVGYFYWVRAISISGDAGPWNATAGTYAETPLSPEWVIEQIEGQLDESAFVNEFLQPIQSIPTIQETLDNHGIRIPTLEDVVSGHAVAIPSIQTILNNYGPRIDAAEGTLVDHTQDIDTIQASLVLVDQGLQANAIALSGIDTRVIANEEEISAQAGFITVLQSTLNDINIGPFDPAANYQIGNLFRYDSVVYQVIATQSQPNATPPNTTYYTPQPDYESIADAVSANASALALLETKVVFNEDGLSAQAQDLSILQSDLLLVGDSVQTNGQAISSLAIRVEATEDGVVSASGDITLLQNALETVEGDLALASSAVQSLDSRVTDTEDGLQSFSQSLSLLNNSISRGDGLQDLFRVWHFDDGLEGWSGTQGVVTEASGVLSVQAQTTTPVRLISPSSLAIEGTAFYQIRARIRRTQGAGWLGRLYYSTISHGFSSGYFKDMPEPQGYINGQWINLEWDMTALSAGGIDWISSDITRLRIDLTETDQDVFEVDWISVGRPGPGGSSRAFTQLFSDVSEIDGRITAQSGEITLLTDSVQSLDGQVEGTAQALNLLNNRVEETENGLISASDSILSLENTITDPVTGLVALSQAYSSLNSRVEENEQGVGAFAEDLTLLNSEIDGVSASLEQKASTEVVQNLEGEIESVKSEYTLKLDAGGKIGGIGLVNDNGSTRAVIASDAVYFIDSGQSITEFDPDTNYSSMTALRNTQFIFGYARVEGQQRFAINVPAYIPEAAITVAQVESAFIDKLVAVQGVFDSAYIARGGFDQSYFSGDLQSGSVEFNPQGQIVGWNSSYTPGVSGWILRNSGNVEFQDGTFRGRIEAESGYISSSLQIGGTSRTFADLDSSATGTANIVNNWRRPGETLIDGNKIRTGDAYVDTLEIKGEAVTVPFTTTVTATNTATGGSQGWGTVGTFSYNHGAVFPVRVVIVFTGFVGASVANGSLTWARSRWRLLRGGTVVGTTEWQEGGSGGYVTDSFYISSLPVGNHTFTLQVSKDIFFSAGSEGGFLQTSERGKVLLMGVKR